ncbi:50S ribosomal protein L24 [Candidatus Pacearchaeota archaeon]|nr:50S ribosomal protein L24 [Candidatus Pacearchaeota archaeon]
MKQKFSASWKGSKQARKQRKYLANAPINVRKLMSANLSKSLRKEYGKRNIPIRNGDEIKIMVGEFKKKTGKINIVDFKNKRVAIEGIQRKKKDGAKLNVWFNPSNLQIQALNLDDKKRLEMIKRKSNNKLKEKEKK